VTAQSTALLLTSLACVAVLHGGCSSDHSRLEKTPGGGGAGPGGEGGAPPTTSSGGSGGGGGIEEPPGPTKLTVVNGIVDYDAIRLCFMPYPDGGAVQPWPGTAGLGYAEAAAIDPIHDVVPDDVDVEIVVIAGALGGTDCETLIMTPPSGALVMSLGMLPESVFDEEKSLLVVPNGCLGGAGHSDDALNEKVCGVGYTEFTPTASLIAGFMSRIGGADKVALQFAQASQGGAALTVGVRAGTDGASAQLIVPEWSLGAIAPFPPFEGYANANLGTLENAKVEVGGAMGPAVLTTVPWSTAFANGGLTAADVQDGSNYTFVGVGAFPGLNAGPWWNGFTVTMVPSDP